ncbi:phosphatase PAP2 family protein [Mucilaginibacter ginkgonis]|uniref:Phosphatase PAP2 family protein n=1 Tax=Mucilaginibacter ginkgonis TaxID=2682091 RepID=A0A6I4I239_9SPHI|nr:phosphatase PAP2 family protein [Mucilaginibacter ginkgonis]QQL50782.1 phosphatase PAP2 family protein [Mucilaginibacter ginkgonis]
MPDFLLQADRSIFHLINRGMANPFFDAIMPWLREPKFWIPVYVFIIAFCIWKFKKQGAIIIVMLAFTVGIADFTSATLIKKAVKRTRPCREQAIINDETVRVGCGTGYSFPSTHATDHFAMSLFLIMVFKSRWKWIWLWAILWATLVCFAQVYVGLHYPVDVAFGGLFGATIGILMALLHKKTQPQFYNI